MYLGTYYDDEKIKLSVCTHRFESGQKFNSVVKAEIGLMTGSLALLTEYNLELRSGYTGWYVLVKDAGFFPIGVYVMIVKANIDLVYVQNHYHFRIEKRPNWLLAAL